jgi:hypothetical protein
MRIAYLSGSYVLGREADSVHVRARVGPEAANDDFSLYGTQREFSNLGQIGEGRPG